MGVSPLIINGVRAPLVLLGFALLTYVAGIIHATTNPFDPAYRRSERVGKTRFAKTRHSLLISSLNKRGGGDSARNFPGILTTAEPYLTSDYTALASHKGEDGSFSESNVTFTEVASSVEDPQRFVAEKKKDEWDWKDGEYGAPVPNKLLYRYASPLLNLARERRLEITDAFRLPRNKMMGTAVPKLTKIYLKEKKNARIAAASAAAGEKNRKMSLLSGFSGGVALEGQYGAEQGGKESASKILVKALIKYNSRLFVVTGILRLFNTMVQAFPALLVARLLRLVESNAPLWTSVRAAAALIAVLSTKMIIENQYFHNVVKYSTQVRGAVTGVIFDKALRVSGDGPSGESYTQTGKGELSMLTGDTKQNRMQPLGSGGVLNLMQSDASILENAALQLHTIWDGPLQISVYTFLLYKYLGRSVLWGISVLLLTIPVNILTLRLLNKLSKYENRAKDARTKRTTETISNMKLLKLQAWERYFAQDIEKERKEELRRHVNRGVVRALNQAVSNAVPAIVLVVTLMAYSRSGKPVVASTIFTAISLFNQLRFPLLFYPMLIDSLANGKNALLRISSYLGSEELVPYVQRLPSVAGQGGSIAMRNGNFLWTSRGQPALCDANLSVGPGEVVAVVGYVGTGKSALVKALLGELSPVPRIALDESSGSNNLLSGPDVFDAPSVIAYGPTVYCSQESWLSKGSLRDAIVFGRPFDEERYKAAIRDAGLDADIKDDGQITGLFSAKASASQGVLTHSTDVGEGGSSLSGGQRARVALARALYESEAGVLLLDDPLSALDPAIGSTVFDRLVARLKKSQTATLFVTNDPALPRRCDRVILMGSDTSTTSPCARIVDVGRYDELIARGLDLGPKSEDQLENGLLKKIVRKKEGAKIQIKMTPSVVHVDGQFRDMNSTVCASTCHADPDCQINIGRDPDCFLDQVLPVATNERDIGESDSEGNDALLGSGSDAFEVITSSEIHLNGTFPDKPKRPESVVLNQEAKSDDKLKSADDFMTTGAVPLSTYSTYFKSVKSPILIGATLLSYLLVNGAQFFQQYVVAKWTELGKGDAMAAALGGKYLRSLAQAACVVSTFLWLRSFLLMKAGVRASGHLHKKMLGSVVDAPISFFDATPSGQLISRFGKELDVVDRALPDGIGSVLFCFLQIFASAAALTGVVTPAMLIPIGLIGTVYMRTMTQFRPAARDLKRCESKSRAPIYTHFREALRGTETIRSIPNGTAMWSAMHRELTDRNLSVFYSVKALDRWLSIRLETLGNGVVFTAAIASIFLSRSGRMKAGSAGWGLTQSLAITGLLTWAVRCLTDLESQMMSVMRIQEISGVDLNFGDYGQELDRGVKMPSELIEAGAALRELYPSSLLPPTPVRDVGLTDAGWPWEGGIDFKNVCMRYNPGSPLVLKNITIKVPPGSTLAVVGRSGSGKSSLLLALFRLVELEGAGSIEIDGVDIRSISLSTLREKLSIIPQDPVLFAGTVMYNLDATGKSSKEDAWAALATASPDLTAQFKEGKGLETVLVEGGKNLSVGQRQLICLARALLRKSKILVLDEATSSVDTQTDAQVQATIRREFVEKGVTVITVAHRLDTVLGYDRIVVLKDGEVAEYGAPNDLLQRGGMLREMVDIDRKKKKKSIPTVLSVPIAQT